MKNTDGALFSPFTSDELFCVRQCRGCRAECSHLLKRAESKFQNRGFWFVIQHEASVKKHPHMQVHAKNQDPDNFIANKLAWCSSHDNDLHYHEWMKRWHVESITWPICWLSDFTQWNTNSWNWPTLVSKSKFWAAPGGAPWCFLLGLHTGCIELDSCSGPFLHSVHSITLFLHLQHY